jgi:ABC-type lipoprotein export system ATPase subunit
MLKASNIHKTYENGKAQTAVLKGVDVAIDEGCLCAVIGPSGAGKSTLLHILSGLDEPTQGNVQLNGKDLYKLPERSLAGIRNTQFGFVFQFYHLLPEFTVEENVMMPALITADRRLKKRDVRALAKRLLDETGLTRRSDHFPNQLSGGEKQRVAIVRSLMNEPRVLFCDEPTGNLDSRTGADVMGLIKRVQRQTRMTVILVTHNAELARDTDRVLHLKDGVLEQA